MFPQELQNWFNERFKGSESIHEYTVFVSEGEHQAIHLSTKGMKGWNQEWKDFKENYPNATSQQIFEEAGRLMDKYKISDAKIARYGQRK